MAKSGDHYYFADLVSDLRSAGCLGDAEELERLDRLADDALRVRSDMAARILQKNYDAIQPRLRPCHRRQGKELAVYCWKFC